MNVIFQIAFILVAIIAVCLFTKKVKEIRRNILLGRDESLNDHPDKRWRNVLLLALGQKKMFKKPLVAVMHFVIYAGFIIINIEVLEIILDGIFGTHRLFRGLLGPVYSWLINSFEFLAVGVIIVCVAFLSRRNVLKLRRFSNHSLDATERGCWWLHIIGIFAFLNYLRFSKHLHIIMAFPNAYYVRLDPQGKMNNMPEIQKEVLYAMQPELIPSGDATQEHSKKFGAKDIFDLSWRNLLDAYSCTECGRCTAACPANITGKKLS